MFVSATPRTARSPRRRVINSRFIAATTSGCGDGGGSPASTTSTPSRSEADRLDEEIAEAPHEEQRANEQDEGQRDLRDDERGAKAHALVVRRDAATPGSDDLAP